MEHVCRKYQSVMTGWDSATNHHEQICPEIAARKVCALLQLLCKPFQGGPTSPFPFFGMVTAKPVCFLDLKGHVSGFSMFDFWWFQTSVLSGRFKARRCQNVVGCPLFRTCDRRFLRISARMRISGCASSFRPGPCKVTIAPPQPHPTPPTLSISTRKLGSEISLPDCVLFGKPVLWRTKSSDLFGPIHSRR